MKLDLEEGTCIICGSKTNNKVLYMHSCELPEHYEACSTCNKYEYTYGNEVFNMRLDDEFWLWYPPEAQKRKEKREDEMLKKVESLRTEKISD